MPLTTSTYLFHTPFLSSFVFAPEVVPFKDTEIVTLDQELSEFEQHFLNPDVERAFTTKNELFTSFAISKAEQSKLSLSEAQQLHQLLVADPEYNFIAKKLRSKKRLTQRDYDQLEFFNIVKTIRFFNRTSFSLDDLTVSFIQQLHSQLTKGLDIFIDHLPNFDAYTAGQWRDTDTVRVGEYQPAPYTQIHEGVEELVNWLKQSAGITTVALFHTALYALHPFRNGNKRVCRVLEYLCLRGLGLNAKNIYSTSTYYHQQKSRYYKYLLQSLERRNLNHFVVFVQEALVYSIITVLKTSLEIKRKQWIDQHQTTEQLRTILKSLMTHREVQFKNLARYTKGHVSRQTLVTYLQKGMDQGIVLKRKAGRTTYYRLNVTTIETETLNRWIALAQKRFSFLPDALRNEL